MTSIERLYGFVRRRDRVCRCTRCDKSLVDRATYERGQEKICYKCFQRTIAEEVEQRRKAGLR